MGKGRKKEKGTVGFAEKGNVIASICENHGGEGSSLIWVRGEREKEGRLRVDPMMLDLFDRGKKGAS